MPLIGLTGGYASGKSRVSSIFKSLGADVIDCDELAREVVEQGSGELKKIVDTFGQSVLLPDTSLDRKALADIVFNDEDKRKTLEAILHPKILDLVKTRSEKILSQNQDAIVLVEAPVLFESGLYKKTDLNITVTCRPDQSLSRARERDKLCDDEINARINAQWSQEKKAESSDYVIDNSGSIEETRRQIVDLLKQIAS